jgi:Right handed beta helix region
LRIGSRPTAAASVGLIAPALAFLALACGGTESKPVPAAESARANDVLAHLSLGGLPAPGSRRYVSPRGSDTNPGTLPRPWRTVQHGLDRLKNGQALLLRGGTYRENLVLTRGGTAKRPLVIQNYPRERAVLVPGDGDENNMPLQVGSGAAYVRLSGLVFEGANGPSTANVYVWGSAHNITFSRCEVRNSARQGFFSESTTRVVSIVGCDFHDNGGSGPDNLDHNIYMEGRDHMIANSVVTGAKNGYGIQLYPSSTHVLVVNNTIVDNRSGVIVGGEGSQATTKALLVNNIVAFNERDGVTTYWGDGSRGRGNFALNNLGYGNGGSNFDSSEGGISYSRNYAGNPQFVSRSTRNYHLRSTSGALDRALRSYAPGFDFDGRKRPQGSRSDEGAFERPR